MAAGEPPAFGVRLRALREAAGHSQEALADRAGLTTQAIGALERGERRHPYPHTIRALAEALRLTDQEHAELAALAPRRGVARSFDGPATRPPIPPTPLLGREHELAVVTAMLDEASVRLVTLTGPGGVGKSRLAIAVAEAAETGGRFPDGVVFVELAPIAEATLVPGAIVAALGLRETGARSAEEVVQRSLQPKRLLLVLDNLEHLLAAAPLVAAVLASCPGVAVLATSRAPLRIRGERECPVEPLPLSSAMALFAERARSVTPSFALNDGNRAAVAALCRRLDGLPLALELAAARVRLLSTEALLARLDYCLPLLTGGHQDQPDRLRTMRDAVAWSYDLLEPVEQSLFRRLSVFAGGFTLEATEAVASEERGEGSEKNVALLSLLPTHPSVLDGVASLVDKSLIRRAAGDERFQMLETIREFGLERLEAAGETEATRSRLAAYLLDLAERAEPAMHGPERRRWLARLAAERDNLRTVLTDLAAAGEAGVEPGLRLGAALWWHWQTGAVGEGRRWIERFLGQATSTGVSERVMARARLVAAVLTMTGQEFDRAEPALLESLAVARRTGDLRLVGRALFFHATILFQRGNLERAAALAAEAESVARSAGDQVYAASARANLGRVATAQGDYERAGDLLADALATMNEAGYQWGVAWVFRALAELADRRGDAAQAVVWQRQCVGAFWEDGDLWGVATGATELAVYAAGRLAPSVAARLIGVASTLRDEIGAPVPQRIGVAHDAVVQRLQAALGSTAFAQAVDVRAGRSIDEVVALGLDTAEPPASTPAHGAHQVGLSGREMEVLALLAQGLTNAAIGERLFISPRTVDAHVHRIYAKLDVSTRVAATRFAIEHGLT